MFPKGRNRLHHGTPQSISEVAEDLGSLTREFRTTKRETSGRIDKVHAKVKVVEGFIKGNAEFVAEVKKLAADSQALATAVRSVAGALSPCSVSLQRMQVSLTTLPP